jgi:hypothetical protein
MMIEYPPFTMGISFVNGLYLNAPYPVAVANRVRACLLTGLVDRIARQTPSFRSGRIARVAKPPYIWSA